MSLNLLTAYHIFIVLTVVKLCPLFTLNLTAKLCVYGGVQLTILMFTWSI